MRSGVYAVGKSRYIHCPGDSTSLENPRNELFASGRYGLKKNLSKNIKFSKSYDHPKLVLFFLLYSARVFIASRMDSCVKFAQIMHYSSQ